MNSKIDHLPIDGSRHRPFYRSFLYKHHHLLKSFSARTTRLKPPSALQSSDPYKVLQVTPGSSLEDIKAAYYQKIKLLHPDVNEQDTTEEAVALNIAYSTLLQGN